MGHHQSQSLSQKESPLKLSKLETLVKSPKQVIFSILIFTVEHLYLAFESRETGILDLSASGLSNFPNGVIKLSDGSKVKKIDLSKNALKALPRDFSQFYEATHLDLSNNNFSHFAIAFTFMYNLVEIDLTNNSFETLSDLELDKMNPKTKIILTGNPINQQGLEVMETFNKGAYNIVF